LKYELKTDAITAKNKDESVIYQKILEKNSV